MGLRYMLGAALVKIDSLVSIAELENFQNPVIVYIYRVHSIRPIH